VHGLLLCPRRLDGAVPTWRATRGACCAYSVLCVSIFDTGCVCSLRSMFVFNRCGVKVGTHDKQQAIVWRDNADIERTEVAQVPQTRDATIEPAELSLSSERPCRSQRRDREARDRHRERDARERDALSTEHGLAKVAKVTTQKMTKTRAVTHIALSLCSTPGARARAHRHTQHTERRHTQIAQITVAERARLRSSVG